MVGLIVSTERANDLGLRAGMTHLADAPLIAVSAVMTSSVETPRFCAILDTVQASRAANVPHMIMLDNSSHSEAATKLLGAGATVVDIDHDTEGGLARPFVIAAQIIDLFAPRALMVKFEGEKPLFESGRNVDVIVRTGKRFDILTGERSHATWDSMPPYQVVTETLLGPVIGQMLGVSHDTPSGVIILNAFGRETFIDTTTVNSWPYLFVTPRHGQRRGQRVGSLTVDFDYHPLVVAEEKGNATFDLKRRQQIDAMLQVALETAGGEENLDHASIEQVDMLRRVRKSLELIAS